MPYSAPQSLIFLAKTRAQGLQQYTDAHVLKGAISAENSHKGWGMAV